MNVTVEDSESSHLSKIMVQYFQHFFKKSKIKHTLVLCNTILMWDLTLNKLSSSLDQAATTTPKKQTNKQHKTPVYTLNFEALMTIIVFILPC